MDNFELIESLPRRILLKMARDHLIYEVKSSDRKGEIISSLAQCLDADSITEWLTEHGYRITVTD